MTARRDLKSIIRERQRKTGESYTTARAHVMGEREKRVGAADEPAKTEPKRVEAAVLAVARGTATIRIVGETTPTTLAANNVSRLSPGHLITISIDRRWSTRGVQHACGRIEDVQIDVARLMLEPLPLSGGDLEDLRHIYEDDEGSDPPDQFWQKLTAKLRPSYEMDGITWGAFPDSDPDDSPTIEAIELAESGDRAGAVALLMKTLARDLRCLDAHAQLGNMLFDRSPARAIVHYEIGVRIGELSLPADFDGVLAWSALYNRPFLRCLHGYGLCLWRLGRFDDARRVFERILSLNPHDNQGIRFCWHEVREGVSWAEFQRAEARREREIAKQAAAYRAKHQVPPTNDPQVN